MTFAHSSDVSCCRQHKEKLPQPFQFLFQPEQLNKIRMPFAQNQKLVKKSNPRDVTTQQKKRETVGIPHKTKDRR